MMIALALVGAGLGHCGGARAEVSSELWPEAAVYVTLGPQTRLYLDLPVALSPDTGDRTVDIAAYLDISLLPIARPALQQRDWQRSRYLWARIGADHIVTSNGERFLGIAKGEAAENRGVVSLMAKAELPRDAWLEARARVDLRWIDGDYSTRYRFKLETTREVELRDIPVVPYANVEWFYDTRYSAWSRTRYELGSEFTLSPGFRLELYLARQDDRVPTPSSVNALGIVGKWYY